VGAKLGIELIGDLAQLARHALAGGRRDSQ